MLVRVIETPVTERYCVVGDLCRLDDKNGYIRCGGVWFTYGEGWVVEELNN